MKTGKFFSKYIYKHLLKDLNINPPKKIKNLKKIDTFLSKNFNKK